MGENGNSGGRITPRGIKVAVLIVAAVISICMSGIASSPATYDATIETLDEQKATVMTLLATSTVASTAISYLPDDHGTPIANELAELNGYFMVILGVLYTEKYLLTVIGYVFCAVLIPIVVALLIYKLFCPEKDWLCKLAARIFAFGLVLYFVTPVSTAVCRKIKETYQYSTQETTVVAEETAEVTETEEASGEEEKSFWDKLSDSVTNAVNNVIDGVTDSVEQLEEVLYQLVENVAIELVVSCVIPILVLLCLLGAMKLILGVEVNFRRLGSVMRRNVPAGKTEVLGEK